MASHKKEMNILESLGTIFEMIEDTCIEPGKDAIKLTKAEQKCVMQAEDVSQEQAILLAYLMENYNTWVDFPDDVARWMGRSQSKMLVWEPFLEDLTKRGFCIRQNNRVGFSYQITEEAFNAIKSGKRFHKEVPKCETATDFYVEIKKLFHKRMEFPVSFEDFKTEFNNLLEENSEQAFVQKVNTMSLSENNRILLAYYCCSRFLNYNSYLAQSHHLQKIFGEEQYKIMASLRFGDNQLIKSNVLVPEENFEDAYSLNDDFAKEVIPTPNTKKNNGEDDDDESHGFMGEREEKVLQYIPYESIPERKLVFTPEVSAQVETIGKILDKDNFEKVKERLKAQGMNSGVVCLLHGMPGTGKTSGVMEMARRTKTDIYLVDISQIRNKYMGDSVKSVKRIFTEYQKVFQKNDRPCCLLINEADAVITKRISDPSGSADSEINACSNMFLQCLEDFDCGCCFLTTNLTENFDAAMERRILMKVYFGKCIPEQREMIWRNSFPTLTNEQVNALSMDYDLSPGEIANIVKKEQINQILLGDNRNLYSSIRANCEREHYTVVKKERTRIGF